jgi:hypothetical protein
LGHRPWLASEAEEDLIDGIYCSACGAKLEEAPTLLPDQRPPCPACGSLARRFEQVITDPIPLSDGGTATDALSVAKTDDSATIAHAQTPRWPSRRTMRP